MPILPTDPNPYVPADGTDWTAQDELVTEWYRQLLGRDPEPGILESYHVPGMTLADIFSGMAGSSEAATYQQRGASPAAPAAPAAAPDEGWAAWFNSLTSGKAPTPGMLTSLESALGEHGVKVLRNAEGIAGKIQLPDGQIVDVIQGATRGGENWQWSPTSGGDLAQGYGREFDYPDFPGSRDFTFDREMPAFTPNLPPAQGFEYDTSGMPAPWQPDLSNLPGPFRYEDFEGITAEDLYQDPSYAFRRQEGLDAVERSAAAKGNLLTGTTLRALQDYASNLASIEFGNVWGRERDKWGANLGKRGQEYASDVDRWMTEFNAGKAGYDTSLQDFLTKYGLARDIYTTGQAAGDTNYGRAAHTYSTNAANLMDTFNRASGTYDRNRANAYDTWAANLNKRSGVFDRNYNIWNTDQGNAFNRLSSLANLGAGAAGNSANLGAMFGSNISNLMNNYNAFLTNLYGQAGNAGAAGTIGSGNAWAGGIGNVGNTASQIPWLWALLNQGKQ